MKHPLPTGAILPVEGVRAWSTAPTCSSLIRIRTDQCRWLSSFAIAVARCGNQFPVGMRDESMDSQRAPSAKQNWVAGLAAHQQGSRGRNTSRQSLTPRLSYFSSIAVYG